MDKPKIRTFDTGATRNLDESKLDFEGFYSPLVMERFAEYMHSHRKQADGSMRDSDNWQKGIPIKSYMKSMYRHFFDVWKNYRGYPVLECMETALCALLFNVQGMLHEILKKKLEADATSPEQVKNLRSLVERGSIPINMECMVNVDEEESRLP